MQLTKLISPKTHLFVFLNAHRFVLWIMKTVEIEAPGNGPENRYVGKMTLDGKTLERTFLKYGELLNGAKIAFEMRPEPNDSRGAKSEDAPYSMSDRE